VGRIVSNSDSHTLVTRVFRPIKESTPRNEFNSRAVNNTERPDTNCSIIVRCLPRAEPGGHRIAKRRPHNRGCRKYSRIESDQQPLLPHQIQSQSTPELLIAGWNPDLPSPAIVNHLIDVFFNCDPCGSRILHKPSFLAAMQLPAYHSKFPHVALLHAIVSGSVAAYKRVANQYAVCLSIKMDFKYRYHNSGRRTSRQVCRVPCQQNETIHRPDDGQRKGHLSGHASVHRVVLVSLPGRAMGRGLDIRWFPDTRCCPIAVELPRHIFCPRRKRTWRIPSSPSRPARTRDQAKDVVDDNTF
jgi:hypothetical protein